MKARSTSAGVKAMVSQKASTLVASLRRGDRRDQLVDGLLDEGVAVGVLAGGSACSASKVGDDPHRLLLAERLGGVEQAQFAGGVEAVAGLDLDRRAAAGHQRVQAAARLLEQLACPRRLLGRGDGRGDAAAGLGDFLIGGAGAAHGMLVGAGAAEDQMRVAVDQARRHPGAAERDDFLGAEAGQFGALADADDLAVLDADGGVGDDAERVAARRAPWSRHGSRRAGGPTCGWP